MNCKRTGHLLLNALLYVLYFLLGLGLGCLTSSVLTSLRAASLRTIPFVICLIVSMMMQSFLHTIGHWLFGHLCGMHTLSLMFLRRAHVREAQQFCTRQTLPEHLLSSCLMAPDHTGGFTGCTLYWLGGTMLNLITSLLSLLIMLLVGWSLRDLPGCFLFSLFLTGLWYALFNGLPLKSGRLPSDGWKALILLRHPYAKEAFQKHGQLLSALSNEAQPLQQLPEAMLTVAPEHLQHADNPFCAMLLLRQYEIHLCLGHTEQAEEILCALYENLSLYPEEWQNRILQECIYLLSMTGRSPELSEQLLTASRLHRYEEMATPASLRCLYAHTAMTSGPSPAAARYHKAAVRACSRIAFRPLAKAFKKLLLFEQSTLQTY